MTRVIAYEGLHWGTICVVHPLRTASMKDPRFIGLGVEGFRVSG